jgi:hypothetical protein
MNTKGTSLNYAINEVRVYNTVGAPLTEAPAPQSTELIDNIDIAPPTTAMYSSAGLIIDTGAADTKFDGDSGRTKRTGGDPCYCIRGIRTDNAYFVSDTKSFQIRIKKCNSPLPYLKLVSGI